MRKVALFFLCFLLFQIVNGQECLEKIGNYYESLDTIERPVYLIVDEMPEIYEPINLMDLFSDSELLKGLNCCPIKIWYAFVVEPDSSITNVEVCSRMIACNDSLISSETIILNERVKALFEKTKSKSGTLNGKKVAVACIRNIHYECME